jgi:guanylate kinase
MDIDVQGAALVRSQKDPSIQEALVDIFILLPSDEELLNRLNFRGTETQEQIELRLKNAHEEMRHWQLYRYTIISANKATDFSTFSSILAGERCRSNRLTPDPESRADHQELNF